MYKVSSMELLNGTAVETETLTQSDESRLKAIEMKCGSGDG